MTNWGTSRMDAPVETSVLHGRLHEDCIRADYPSTHGRIPL
jgi:hypothetical protein